MVHSYAHFYGLPITLFRFFTVYGPWGRQDAGHFNSLEPFLQVGRLTQPITMHRGFTYIDDLIDGITR